MDDAAKDVRELETAKFAVRMLINGKLDVDLLWATFACVYADGAYSAARAAFNGAPGGATGHPPHCPAHDGSGPCSRHA